MGNNNNHNKKNTMKWTTFTTYIDKETGEIIRKKEVLKKIYIKLKHTITHEKLNTLYGERHVTWECERNRQIKLNI